LKQLADRVYCASYVHDSVPASGTAVGFASCTEIQPNKESFGTNGCTSQPACGLVIPESVNRQAARPSKMPTISTKRQAPDFDEGMHAFRVLQEFPCFEA
jgi:hypothetical protein